MDKITEIEHEETVEKLEIDNDSNIAMKIALLIALLSDRRILFILIFLLATIGIFIYFVINADSILEHMNNSGGGLLPIGPHIIEIAPGYGDNVPIPENNV